MRDVPLTEGLDLRLLGLMLTTMRRLKCPIVFVGRERLPVEFDPREITKPSILASLTWSVGAQFGNFIGHDPRANYTRLWLEDEDDPIALFAVIEVEPLACLPAFAFAPGLYADPHKAVPSFHGEIVSLPVVWHFCGVLAGKAELTEGIVFAGVSEKLSGWP